METDIAVEQVTTFFDDGQNQHVHTRQMWRDEEGRRCVRTTDTSKCPTCAEVDDEPIIYAVLTKKQLNLIIKTLIKERSHLNKILDRQELTDKNADEIELKVQRINEAIHVLLIERKNQKERMDG